MKVILSTNNPAKRLEIDAIFSGSKISLISLADAGIIGEAMEDGQTLQDNALKKALFAWEPGRWTMSDDSGVFIDALDGKPGVDTADWHGQKEKTNDVDRVTQWILEQLQDIKDRSATFKTVVAIISPEGEQYFFTGEMRGKILKAMQGKSRLRVPYNTIFMPDGLNKVMAEMTIEEENKISHRGKAFTKARGFLESLQENM